MKLINFQTIQEALIIILLSCLVGFLTNIFHPRRVKISLSPPALFFTADSSSADDLPPIIIDAEQQQGYTTPIIFTWDQTRELLQNNSAILLDARDGSAYDKFHIQGAYSLPYDDIVKNKKLLQNLPKNKWLITYCDDPTCDLAELLAYELIYAGYKYVAYYLEGIEGWKKLNADSLQDK